MNDCVKNVYSNEEIRKIKDDVRKKVDRYMGGRRRNGGDNEGGGGKVEGRAGLAAPEAGRSGLKERVGRRMSRTAGPGPGNEGGEPEEKVLPWAGAFGPPAVSGSRFPNGAIIPSSTIQPGLLRNAESVPLQEALSLHESPVLAEVASQARPAFVRAGIERARAILFCLGDSGNLVEQDVMSVKTFNELNKHAQPPYKLEPFHGVIYAVNGKPLTPKGVLREGLLLQLEGTSAPIRIYPVVCSDFKGTHLNISQSTLADHVISYHPTPRGGFWKMASGEKVPLVVKKPPLYTTNHGDDVLKRISIWRIKNGFLTKRSSHREVGEMKKGGGISDDEGLKALATENQLLREATKHCPLMLTSDGFLTREGGKVGQGLENKGFLEDAFVGHEELRGLAIEELQKRFEGEEGMVTHLKHLPEGRPMFLAPQVGRLVHDLQLASGEAKTVVVRATMPSNSYVLADSLNEDEEAGPDHLQGCLLSPSLTLCFNGKTALVVITNGSIGPVQLKANSPVCRLSVVRPHFERQIMHERQQQKGGTTGGAEKTLGEITRAAPVAVPVHEGEAVGQGGMGDHPAGQEEDEAAVEMNHVDEVGQVWGEGNEDEQRQDEWGEGEDILSTPGPVINAEEDITPGPVINAEEDIYWSSDEEGEEEEGEEEEEEGKGDREREFDEDLSPWTMKQSVPYCEGLGGGPDEKEGPPRPPKRGKPSLELAMQAPWTSERWRFGRLLGEGEEESEDEADPVQQAQLSLENMTPEQRKQHLAKELGLDSNPILLASPKHLERLKDIVERHHHIFTDGKTYNHVNIPACPYVQCRVVLDPNKGPHTPYRATPRPMSPIQRTALREKIEQWRKQGAIEPSASPWSFPLVAVEKKRRPGQQFPEYRYCVDLRILNNIAYKDSCFSGSVPANLALLEGHKYYASLDLFSSYESIEVAPDSRDFFSFSGADGEHWRMRRMTMGFCNSPGIMARVTSLILQGLPTSSRQAEAELGLGGDRPPPGEGAAGDRAWLDPKLRGGGALGYVDDILCFDMSLDGLLNWLEEIFGRVSRAKCLVKTSKACLVREEVDYLGFVVGRHGRKMQPSYRESVVNWPLPEKRQHLASFLGRTGYYREFIKDFSHLTHSLNQAKARPDHNWRLTEQETHDFHRLQDEFTRSEALSFPCFKDLKAHPFILDLDFSQKGLSASLHQRQKCSDGKYRERLIGNISRKAPSALAISSSHRGEVASAVMGLQHFRHLLLLAEFVMRSDSLSVRFLKNLKDLRGCFPRYFELLAQFKFVSIHRGGSQNAHDDNMSRAAHILPPMTDEELEIHVPPTMGEVKGEATSQRESEAAELMAHWEDQEGGGAGKVATTVAAWTSARWDPRPPVRQDQYWEAHPLLGYLNEVRREIDETGTRKEEEGEAEEEEEGREAGEADDEKEDGGGNGGGRKEGESEWDRWAIATPVTRLAPTSLFDTTNLQPPAGHGGPWVVGLSVADMVEMQKKDANLEIVRRWVQDGKGPSRTQLRQARAGRELWAYRQMLHLIRLEGELLVVQRMRGQMTRAHRLLVPRAVRLRIVAAGHQQYCKHRGPDSTVWSIHTGCYWPGLTRDVEDYVSTCGSCWQKRYPPAKHQSFDRFTRTAGYVGQLLAADLIGPLPNEEGYRYCLTALDLFSRYLYLVPLRNKTAEEVASAFEWGVVTRGGGVEAVFTDRGKEWLNQTFSKLCDQLAVRHTYTLPYSPSANGALERAHRVLKTLVRACLGANKSNGWVNVAKGVVAAYNSTTNPATGLTPFFLMHGRECALPLTHFVIPPLESAAPKLTSRDRWVQIGRQMTLYFLQQRLGMEVVQRRISHQGAGFHPLYPLHRFVGAEVVACVPALTRKYAKTFAPRFLGPYFIVEAHSNVVATIRSNFYARIGQQEMEHTVGLDRLLPVRQGTRWEDGGVNLPMLPVKPHRGQKEQQWAAIDLDGEILKGAAPECELARLDQDSSDLDHLWDKFWDAGGEEEEEVGEGPRDDGRDENVGEEEEKGGGGGGGGGVGGGGGDEREEEEGELALPQTGSTPVQPPQAGSEGPSPWSNASIRIETELEEEVEEDLGDGKRMRRRSRSRSLVSVGRTMLRSATPSRVDSGVQLSGGSTPPSAPTGGWRPTPPRQRESTLADPSVVQQEPEQGAASGQNIGSGKETTTSQLYPVSAQAESANVLEPAGKESRSTTRHKHRGETPVSVPLTLPVGRVEEESVHPSSPQLHPRTGLPPRTARARAERVFADPFVKQTLWGKERTGRKRQEQKKK